MQGLSSKFKKRRLIQRLQSHFKKLIIGEAEHLFFELLFSSYIQMQNEEYIDFIGRVYRYKEAMLKYLFILKHGKKKISLHSNSMGKKHQLKILRKKYKIYTYNFSAALSQFFKKYHSKDRTVMKILGVLNSRQMLELMSLRNSSIIGHGFLGASRLDLVGVYGEPLKIIEDLKKCISMLELELDYTWYDTINEMLIKESKKIENFLVKGDEESYEW